MKTRAFLCQIETAVVVSLMALLSCQAQAFLPAAQELRVFSIDYCEADCPTDAAIPHELRQVYNYMHSQNGGWDYNKMIPGNLQSGEDPSLAAGKIADQTFQYWWNSSGAKDTPVGRNVNFVEQGLQKDVKLGPATPGGVDQKLNFAFDLFQAQAKIKYEGYAKAELFYKTTDESMGLQVFNKIDKSKDLIFGEAVNPATGPTSTVTFKWNF